MSSLFLRITRTSLLIVLLTIIPVRLAIAQKLAPNPQRIVMLGGGDNREAFTAQFAHLHPNLDIWVSTGSPKKRPLFQAAGITAARIHFDERATDTVTNFTTLVPILKQQHIQHVYVLTSDYHMPRAMVIAFLVLGSQGITFTPVTIPDLHHPESGLQMVRDVGRCFLWLATGHTGARLNPRLFGDYKPRR